MLEDVLLGFQMNIETTGKLVRLIKSDQKTNTLALNKSFAKPLKTGLVLTDDERRIHDQRRCMYADLAPAMGQIAERELSTIMEETELSESGWTCVPEDRVEDMNNRIRGVGSEQRACEIITSPTVEEGQIVTVMCSMSPTTL